MEQLKTMQDDIASLKNNREKKKDNGTAAKKEIVAVKTVVKKPVKRVEKVEPETSTDKK